MKKERPEVKPGQIYQDKDKRREGRYVKVKFFDKLNAYCAEVTSDGREIDTDRAFRRFAIKTLQTRFNLLPPAF